MGGFFGQTGANFQPGIPRIPEYGLGIPGIPRIPYYGLGIPGTVVRDWDPWDPVVRTWDPVVAPNRENR